MHVIDASGLFIEEHKAQPEFIQNDSPILKKTQHSKSNTPSDS